MVSTKCGCFIGRVAVDLDCVINLGQILPGNGSNAIPVDFGRKAEVFKKAA